MFGSEARADRHQATNKMVSKDQLVSKIHPFIFLHALLCFARVTMYNLSASGHLAASHTAGQSVVCLAALCHLLHIPKLPTVFKYFFQYQLALRFTWQNEP